MRGASYLQPHCLSLPPPWDILQGATSSFFHSPSSLASEPDLQPSQLLLSLQSQLPLTSTLSPAVKGMPTLTAHADGALALLEAPSDCSSS